MKIGEITKTGDLATTFPKPTGGANLYFQFGYGPLGPLCLLGLLLSTTPNKVTVFCDLYISILVKNLYFPPSSTTDKANSNNNKL